jgi:HK97 family phage major capsid protein
MALTIDRGTVTKLKNDRSKAHGRMQAILNEVGDGDWSKEQDAEWKTLEAEMNRLNGQIELIEDNLADGHARVLDRAGRPGAPSARLEWDRPMNAADVAEFAARKTGAGRLYAQEEAIEGLGWYLKASARQDFSIIPEQFKNTLTEGTGSAGGYTVSPALVGALVGFAYPQSTALRAGVRVIPMSAARVSVPRIVSVPTGQWRAENELITPEDITFGATWMEAKSLSTIVKASMELIDDSEMDIPNLVAEVVGKSFATAIDKAVFAGPGVGGEMTGIRNWDGVPATGSVGTLDYDDLIDGVDSVRSHNYEPNAQVLFRRTDTALAKSKEETTNAYLTPPSYLDGIPRLRTNALAYENTNEAYVLTGDFSYAYLGVRLANARIVLDQKYAEYGQVGWAFHWRGDHAVVDVNAFDLRTGVTN